MQLNQNVPSGMAITVTVVAAASAAGLVLMRASMIG